MKSLEETREMLAAMKEHREEGMKALAEHKEAISTIEILMKLTEVIQERLEEDVARMSASTCTCKLSHTD